MELLLLAAEEAEGGGGIEFLLPAPAELYTGILAFAIVFLVMWKFAVPGMKKLMDERQAAIAGQIKEAEAAKSEAESLLDDYKSQVAGAKSEANEIVEAARADAERVRAEVLAKAEEEAQGIRAKAAQEAEAEKSRAVQEAKAEVANLSMALAEKVVGGALDGDRQRALVDQYLAELERGE